jgi:hypothetical protein
MEGWLVRRSCSGSWGRSRSTCSRHSSCRRVRNDIQDDPVVLGPVPFPSLPMIELRSLTEALRIVHGSQQRRPRRATR